MCTLAPFDLLNTGRISVEHKTVRGLLAIGHLRIHWATMFDIATVYVYDMAHVNILYLGTRRSA